MAWHYVAVAVGQGRSAVAHSGQLLCVDKYPVRRELKSSDLDCIPQAAAGVLRNIQRQRLRVVEA